jgi:predicted transposase/invertase (TIGR01784 family)
MKHRIDPKVDCVFKALLGTEENLNLTIHFLNALLADELPKPIAWVQILNPYNDKESLTDKISVVDIKARDAQQRVYQIEIQLVNTPFLANRIAYNWTDIYSQQLKNGQDYDELKPTYSIWLLVENLLKRDKNYLHHYKLRDQHNGCLNNHGGIWLVELKKFAVSKISSEQQRWLTFFKQGQRLDDKTLPNWMNTTEMRQAMDTLVAFSDKDSEYFAYRARQEFLRLQRMQEKRVARVQQLEQEKEAITLEKAQALQQVKAMAQKNVMIEQEKEVIEQEKAQVLAENAQLKALIAQLKSHQ